MRWPSKPRAGQTCDGSAYPPDIPERSGDDMGHPTYHLCPRDATETVVDTPERHGWPRDPRPLYLCEWHVVDLTEQGLVRRNPRRAP